MAIRAAGVGYRNLAAQNVQVSASPAQAPGPTVAATSGPASVLMPIASLPASKCGQQWTNPQLTSMQR